MDEKQNAEILKELGDLRRKTEQHYRDYRNAGIAISTIFLSFVTGIAYKILTGHAISDLRIAFALMTASVIFGIFLYQVVLYGGFRFVAHAHYYQLMWFKSLLDPASDTQARDKVSNFSQESNRWFGFADKLFILICSGLLGHMLVCGLICFRINSVCGAVLAFCLPVIVGICRAAELRT